MDIKKELTDLQRPVWFWFMCVGVVVLVIILGAYAYS